MGNGRGACASGDPYSALAGRSALLEGGNAVDAVVAAGLMAAFTMPPMTGLAGAGLLTLRAEGEVRCLDFFANVPGRGAEARARPEPEVVKVPFEDVVETFLVGPATVAVPGVVAGLWEAHERYGRLPLADLAAIVVDAARRGVEVQDAQYRGFVLLQSIFQRTPETWAFVGDDQGLLPVGRPLRNPDLAETLEELVRDGKRAFYEGQIARDIVAASDGLVTREDLAAYEPVWRPPLTGSYRGHVLSLCGVPSLSGGMVLAALSDLERGPPVPTRREREDWWRVADALRRAQALRTPEYETNLFREGYLEGVAAACRAGSTLHVSVVDGEGGAASYTSSMGETAGIAVPGRGFVLNNLMGEPDILPRGTRNAAGLRMMSSMCPGLVCDADGRWMAIGSAGGGRIPAAILQVLVHVLDGGRSLQEAVSLPRIHVFDERLYVEGYGRTREEVESFRAYGLEVVATWAPGFFFGGLQAARQRESGFEAAADGVRRGGVAYVL